jgi:hypothetical protein
LENALLTNSERQWLTGKKKVSKIYEYRIKSNIKKKIEILRQIELPLLLKHGFINDLSVFTQLSEYPQLAISDNNKLTPMKHQYIEIYAQNHSLERDLDPRPFPYQGNALPG